MPVPPCNCRGNYHYQNCHKAYLRKFHKIASLSTINICNITRQTFHNRLNCKFIIPSVPSRILAPVNQRKALGHAAANNRPFLSSSLHIYVECHSPLHSQRNKWKAVLTTTVLVSTCLRLRLL